jgi:hypothetical protein
VNSFGYVHKLVAGLIALRSFASLREMSLFKVCVSRKDATFRKDAKSKLGIGAS